MSTPGNGYNAGSEKQVADAQKRTKLRDERRVNGLRQTMRSRDGRLWVWDLLEKAHIFDTSFTGNSATFFKEGERNQALQILADLSTHCVPEFLALMAERSADPQDALRRSLAILNAGDVNQSA